MESLTGTIERRTAGRFVTDLPDRSTGRSAFAGSCRAPDDRLTREVDHRPMASVSARERIAHALRRLSMGPHPDLAATIETPAGAIEAALDLSAPPATPIPVPPPSDDRPRPADLVPLVRWWLDRMASPERLIEERLVWFWHDHFATAISKVRVPHLMYRQHVTVRTHATGSFAELLKAIARDPAMLVYLDGISNRAGEVNENFGRECLELFTVGRRAPYTQGDVVAMSRACSGWVVKLPGRPRLARLPGAPFDPVFVPARHDSGTKRLLGRTGAFDLDGALDVVLAQPDTARFVAGKLYRELVGLEPDTETVRRLGAEFARGYEILGLVRAIAAEPAFLSDAAVRTRVRTPVEKLVALLQATGASATTMRPAVAALLAVGYVPFNPPNVGGYPQGVELLGPHQLVHAFDLLGAIAAPPPEAAAPDVEPLLARLGVFDVSPRTRRALLDARDPGRRFALALGSPEMVLT